MTVATDPNGRAFRKPTALLRFEPFVEFHRAAAHIRVRPTWNKAGVRLPLLAKSAWLGMGKRSALSGKSRHTARFASRHLQRPAQPFGGKIGFDRRIECTRDHLIGDKATKTLACRGLDGRAPLFAPFHAKVFGRLCHVSG